MCSQLHHIISVSLSEQVEKGTTHTNTDTHARANNEKTSTLAGNCCMKLQSREHNLQDTWILFSPKKYNERFLVLVHSFIMTITPTQLYYQVRAIVPKATLRIYMPIINNAPQSWFEIHMTHAGICNNYIRGLR